MGWIRLSTNPSHASQAVGLLGPISCPGAVHPWEGTPLCCLCDAKSMALGRLKPWPWVCEAAPGEMQAVLGQPGTWVVPTKGMGDPAGAGRHGRTHGCSWVHIWVHMGKHGDDISHHTHTNSVAYTDSYLHVCVQMHMLTRARLCFKRHRGAPMRTLPITAMRTGSFWHP